MLNQILKFTLISSVALFLRKRWKRLSACALAIVAAFYIHGEYLDYVGALPAGTPAAAQAGEYLLTVFLLKNAVIAAAVLVVIVLEVRASRGKGTAHARQENAASSSPRGCAAVIRCGTGRRLRFPAPPAHARQP